MATDLYDTVSLAKAAAGAAVVVHALNPVYTHKAWKAQVLSMAEAATQVARTLEATLMVPGNIYNFGEGMPAVLREDTPQLGQTIKGRIRIAMESQLQRSGVRTVVIRAGDFFGSGEGTWFDQVIVKDLHKGRINYPGGKDTATAWAYLPDLARTFVAVAAKRALLPDFEVLHFAGHSLTGQQWVNALSPAAQSQSWIAQGATLRLSAMPWSLIRLGAMLLPTWAALVEMRYVWLTPHALANDKLLALLSSEPHTPLAQAAQTALVDLGLLSTSNGAPSHIAA
jgi:nucleoside-diphosphate-sugar epimerase